MNIDPLREKLFRKIRGTVVRATREHAIYPKLYPSYWHMRIKGKGRKTPPNKAFFSAIPNPGAGIGHQLANWIAGYWFSQKFGLKFAHIPFSNPRWEHVLGLFNGQVLVSDLLDQSGYRSVRLPLFDEYNSEEMARTENIIESYSGQNVVFIAEQDQFYKDQFGSSPALKKLFYTAPARSEDNVIYNKDTLNIAIHVRRGDIVMSSNDKNDNLKMRWQDNGYFENVLQSVLEIVKNRNYRIFLFSQGRPEDFATFEKFDNISLCLDMNAIDSFLHMCFADILITSKSSFSYKPALINRGLKLCPENFWHGYPSTPDWIMVGDNAQFDTNKFNDALLNLGK
jgi:hypothetical protein